MGRGTRRTELGLLGRSEAALPPAPAASILETFPNPSRGREYRVRFECADFTSLCPVTGQPDFGAVRIEYVPGTRCVESKSLKFYLAAYRNERAFNEAAVNRILTDFVAACRPVRVVVTGEFAARGGIALTVVAEHPVPGGRRRAGRRAR